jgi:hypothetical protein
MIVIRIENMIKASRMKIRRIWYSSENVMNCCTIAKDRANSIVNEHVRDPIVWRTEEKGRQKMTTPKEMISIITIGKTAKDRELNMPISITIRKRKSLVKRKGIYQFFTPIYPA